MLPVEAGIGQSSSVMLDQKTQIMITARRVKRVEKKPPLMAPFEPLQMCTLITYWKIWLMMKRSAAAQRYTGRGSVCIRAGRDRAGLTHWSDFAQDAENQDRLENEERHEEDERNQLVQSVQSVRPVVRVVYGVLPVVGEGKPGVESNVASANKQRGGGAEDEANGRNRTVVNYLVSNHRVHEQNPESSDNGGDVNGCESSPYFTVQREPANGEDLA